MTWGQNDMETPTGFRVGGESGMWSMEVDIPLSTSTLFLQLDFPLPRAPRGAQLRGGRRIVYNTRNRLTVGAPSGGEDGTGRRRAASETGLAWLFDRGWCRTWASAVGLKEGGGRTEPFSSDWRAEPWKTAAVMGGGTKGAGNPERIRPRTQQLRKVASSETANL